MKVLTEQATNALAALCTNTLNTVAVVTIAHVTTVTALYIHTNKFITFAPISPMSDNLHPSLVDGLPNDGMPPLVNLCPILVDGLPNDLIASHADVLKQGIDIPAILNILGPYTVLAPLNTLRLVSSSVQRQLDTVAVQALANEFNSTSYFCALTL